MTTVLTIMADPVRTAMYDALARRAGVQLISAEGALHALTQLERTPVDAIICDAHMDEMSGEEFRAVTEQEEHTSAVPVFILPDSEALSGQQGLGVPAYTGPELLSLVLTHLERDEGSFPVPMNPQQAPQLQGDLDAFTLTEFLNWVAEMKFNGHWIITLQDAEQRERSAHLFMQNGNVVYVEFGGLVGKGALFWLLRSIEQFSAAFRFYKTDLTLPLRSEDLKLSTPRLLMELAVAMDNLTAPGHQRSHDRNLH